jgi:hypothetical protein
MLDFTDLDIQVTFVTDPCPLITPSGATSCRRSPAASRWLWGAVLTVIPVTIT